MMRLPKLRIYNIGESGLFCFAADATINLESTSGWGTSEKELMIAILMKKAMPNENQMRANLVELVAIVHNVSTKVNAVASATHRITIIKQINFSAIDCL